MGVSFELHAVLISLVDHGSASTLSSLCVRAGVLPSSIGEKY